MTGGEPTSRIVAVRPSLVVVIVCVQSGQGCCTQVLAGIGVSIIMNIPKNKRGIPRSSIQILFISKSKPHQMEFEMAQSQHSILTRFALAVSVIAPFIVICAGLFVPEYEPGPEPDQLLKEYSSSWLRHSPVALI